MSEVFNADIHLDMAYALCQSGMNPEIDNGLYLLDVLEGAKAEIARYKRALEIRKKCFQCPECKAVLHEGRQHLQTCVYYDLDEGKC